MRLRQERGVGALRIFKTPAKPPAQKTAQGDDRKESEGFDFEFHAHKCLAKIIE